MTNTTTTKRRGRPNPLELENFQRIFQAEDSEKILLSLVNAYHRYNERTSRRYDSIIKLDSTDVKIPSIHFKAQAQAQGARDHKNIELHVLKEEHLAGGFNDYWGKIMTDTIKGVDDYSVSDRVEKIYLVDYDLFDKKREYETIFNLNKSSNGNNILGGGVTLVFYELAKFKKMTEKQIRAEWTTREPFLKWLVFLSPSSNPQLLKEAILLDEDIKEAEERLHKSY